MATIADVARAAQVSTATVSHVINGTRPVRKETRARVNDAIQQVGYHRDALARAMRRNSTETIGLIVSDPRQHVFGDMIQGVQQEARAAGYTTLLAHSGGDADREFEAIRTLKERRVDGLILAEVSHEIDHVRDLLQLDDIPLVLLDRIAHRQVDQVGSETLETMSAIVNHLVEAGRNHIGIIAGDLTVPTLQERFHGFKRAIAVSDLAMPPRWIVQDVRTDREARVAVRAMLLSPHRPDALITASTDMTVGTLRALKELGLTVPNDIALISFDELPYADIFEPQVTSIAQPAEEIGRQAVRLFLRRLVHPDAQPQTIQLEPHVMHRTSCGCGGAAFTASAGLHVDKDDARASYLL